MRSEKKEPLPIKEGQAIFIVPKTRKTKCFPDGVIRGKCVRIMRDSGIDKYLCRYNTDWGYTSGWYSYDSLGHSEEDWLLKKSGK